MYYLPALICACCFLVIAYLDYDHGWRRMTIANPTHRISDAAVIVSLWCLIWVFLTAIVLSLSIESGSYWDKVITVSVAVIGFVIGLTILWWAYRPERILRVQTWARIGVVYTALFLVHPVTSHFV